MDQDITITLFDSRAATEADFLALNRFGNQIKAESWPDDPPATLEETKRDWQPMPAYLEQLTWLARTADGGVLAEGGVSFLLIGANTHAGQVWIGVLPEARRRGLGTRLLARVAEAARERGRRLLIGSTLSAVPAGDAFMAAVGADLAMRSITNQLDLRDLDLGLVEAWMAAGRALEGEFELGLWDGPYPESDLREIAELGTVMNGAPRQGLELEDSRPDADRLRQEDEWLAKRGTPRWTMYVRERSSGRLTGYTEVVWDPAEPHVLHQGDTGVFPEYRNRGLAKWLKAAMLTKVLEERPQVRFVRTGNANDNAPMLHINERLGFWPYRSSSTWQISVEQAAEDLSQRLKLTDRV